MKRVSFVAICAVAVLFWGAAEAVTCNPQEFSPCMPAFTSPAAPTAACCSKLQEQEPCLCGYIKNPGLKPYVDTPNAKRVASDCKVPWPQC
ncbi:non-specific lipid-transfer protein 2-like [Hibiscus syriacus]|uniref:non-specific lipid-transfer protein 2-like n=1 Tax=Hibiscus syriacus TaxID=106335 RepID=UPI0019248E46|nr:non-specific lipid-transfer protein 2-like [Hibiscus syriacus]